MRAVAFVIVTSLGGLACQPPGYSTHHDVDAAGSGVTDAATTAIDASPDAPTSGVCNDMFRLDGHGAASTAWVTGDFCAWGVDPDHGAFPLTKGGDGAWTGTRQFTPGTYQYKFVIDTTMWIPDPNDPDVVDDGFGGHNSVYTCTP
jgi:Glycogen recognition site of AMP-activated protein kinase